MTRIALLMLAVIIGATYDLQYVRAQRFDDLPSKDLKMKPELKRKIVVKSLPAATFVIRVLKRIA